MTDDRTRRPDRRDDELDELLGAIDGPVRFPEPGRSKLRAALIDTLRIDTLQSGRGASPPPAVVPLRTSAPVRRRWLPAVAATIIALVSLGALVAVVARPSTGPATTATTTPAPASTTAICDDVRTLAVANGVLVRAVPVAAVDRDELAELAGALGVLGDRASPGDAEGYADAATLVRFVITTIDAGADDARIDSALAAARDRLTEVDDASVTCRPG